MNDELTPSEHADLRARLITGTKRIKPVGKHRAALVSGSVAVALVAMIAGGVTVGATLSAPPITGVVTPTPAPAETTTPTSTPSDTPTQTPTSTPAPTPPPTLVSLNGDCEHALDDSEASSIVGAPVELAAVLAVEDPAVLGGISCAWRSVEDRWSVLGVSVYPVDVVPDEVMARIGIVPECGGGECAYAERSGDAWVSAWGGSAEQAMQAVALVAARAEAEPGEARFLGSGAWQIPDCDGLRGFIGGYLGREDLLPYAGDAHPQGMTWDVLVGNGAASWCSSLGVGNDFLSENIEVYLAPGSSAIDPDVGRSQAASRVNVVGADESWFVPSTERPTGGMLYMLRGENVLAVAARFLDQATILDLAEVLLAELDG